MPIATTRPQHLRQPQGRHWPEPTVGHRDFGARLLDHGTDWGRPG